MNFQDIKAWLQRVYGYMTPREKTILGGLGLLLIISLSLSITGYVNRHSTLVPQDGGTYNEALVGQPRYINPILASTNDIDLDLTKVVYSSLFKVGSDSKLQNDLATSVDTSKDGKVYTIHMRDDATWHDGKPVTADDVLFTITSIQTKDYNSSLASAFQGVQVDKVDDHTIRFTLQKTPYAPFLSSLTVGIVPKHVWENIPPKSVNLAEQELRPIGSGPYKFEELVTKKKTGEVTSIRFTRNDSYYGQKAHIATLIFTFFNTHEDAVTALSSSKVDGIGYLPLSLYPTVKNRTGITVHKIRLPQYFGLFFNQSKNPILADVGVRSALSLAVDRETIIKEALNGQGELLGVPIASGVFDFSNIDKPVFDLEKAKQNLEDAGWKVTGEDGVRTKDGKPLEVTITTTDWQEYVKTAELIQETWKQLGVKVTIQSLGTGIVQQTAVVPREYQILLYGENLAADPDPYPFWHSTQVKSPGLNLSLLEDKDTDKALEGARTTNDNAKRQELLHSFAQRFLDIHPAIILYSPYYLFAERSHVGGFTMEHGGLPSDRLNDIVNWYVRVKRVWNS